MTEPAVELVGAERFSATTRAAIADLKDLSDAHRAAGDLIERRASAAAPRRTGDLASAFGTRVTAAGVEVVNTADHAKFVQFGTRHMDAQPFMPDAGDVERDLTPIYVDAVDEAIQQIEGK